jgi:hypothetical protein
MIENENKNYKLLLIFSTVSVLILTAVFGIATLLGPKKPTEVAKIPDIVIPTTMPEFNSVTLNKVITPSCAISDSQVEFTSKTNELARVELVDVSKPYKEGYSLDKIAYLNGYLTGSQPWNKDDGTHVALTFGHACGGYVSRQVEDTSKAKELTMANMMQSKSVYAIEGQNAGGTLTFNAVAKRGNYVVWLKTQSSALNAKEAGISAKCTVNNTLDQACYDKELTSDENKALLNESATKAILEFKF